MADAATEFIQDNLMVKANLFHEAFKAGVKEALIRGRSCVYRKPAQRSMSAAALLGDALEPANRRYAIAKSAGIKLCKDYKCQQGEPHVVDCHTLMATIAYRPDDNYHPGSGRVITGIISRFHEAKITFERSVASWRTARARRAFLYADDRVAACGHIRGLPKRQYGDSTTQYTMRPHRTPRMVLGSARRAT